MSYADPTTVEAIIADTLNAQAGVWGGAVVDKRRSATAITKARVAAGMEILRAIASNPKGGYWGSYATLVTVAHNSFLPAYDGEPGIPLVVPFQDAPAVEGMPATPAEIDAFRSDPNVSVYTGAYDGVPVAHDAADANGVMSPLACRYSIEGGRFKFTGYSAQIPLVQLTRQMADTQVPENFEPTLVKLAVPKLLKEGDNLTPIAQAFAAAGLSDLADVARGAAQVPPLPLLEAAQKARAI